MTTSTIRADIRVGDIVRIAKGRKDYRVTGFWGADDTMAALEPLNGYTGASATLARLVLVRREA